jgi:hypothetical protein
MRIKGNGNVGIGTSNPTARLHVLGAEAAGLTGIYAEGTVGVHGFSTGGLGVRGVSPDGFGVRGDSTNGNGVRGTSTNSDGVFGSGKNGVHGLSASASDSGVWGQNTGGGYGVAGSTNSSVESGIPGVLGQNDGTGIGVKGTAASGGIGVYGSNGNSSSGYAGYFNGGVNVTGNLDAKNLPGVKFGQCSTTDFHSLCDLLAPGQSQDFDKFTVNVPAPGYLFIAATIKVFTYSIGTGLAQFNLFNCDSEACGGGVYLVRQTNTIGDTAGGTTVSISWVLQVDTAGPVTLKTNGTNANLTSNIGASYHNLTAIYLPKQY